MRLTRQAKGLTLDELADRSSVSRAALSKIERGERNPSLKYALQIAEALRTPLSELLGQRHQPITVVRQGKTIRLVDPASRAVRESLLRPQPGAELIRYTLPPCTAIDPFPFHEAGTTETFVVLEGSCSVSAGDIHIDLDTGDAATMPGDRDHQLGNPGSVPAVVLLLILRPK